MEGEHSLSSPPRCAIKQQARASRHEPAARSDRARRQRQLAGSTVRGGVHRQKRPLGTLVTNPYPGYTCSQPLPRKLLPTTRYCGRPRWLAYRSHIARPMSVLRTSLRDD